MKVLLLFAFLFAVASAQHNPHPIGSEEDESPFPEFEVGEVEGNDGFETVTTDDETTEDETTEDVTTDEDDDDDDDPTTTPQPKHQCKKKFWDCKKQTRRFDCDGKLKCFEDKSKCYQAYKANNPNLPTKSPEKMACKTTFEGCIAKADGTCRSKLLCYIAKQKCYMKSKPMGHRRRHHHRHRPHHRHGHRRHHHRPTPCPKVMKCKKEWMMCMIKSRTCKDKLACFWKTHKCMEKSRPSPSPSPSVDPTSTPSPSPSYKRWRPRRWNPKVVAKCKEDFKKCINGTSTCRKQIGCFIEMKKCIMHGHRPTPCPKMMKCKMEYKNCTQEATTCDEKLTCMYQKHECYERMRPTTPPPTTGTGIDSDEDDSEDRMYGYGRRPRWNPKKKEKCKKELHKCLNESDSCQEKMKCFWGMKKCMMSPRHGMQWMKPLHIHMKLKQIKNRIKNHFHGIFSNVARRAKPWMQKRRQNMRNRMQQIGNRFKNWGQQLKQKWQARRQKMQQKFGSGKNRFKQWKRKPWSG